MTNIVTVAGLEGGGGGREPFASEPVQCNLSNVLLHLRYLSSLVLFAESFVMFLLCSRRMRMPTEKTG